MVEQHSFIFPIADLKERVEKNTSYLGMMRESDNEPHMSDRLSLTDGESFLSDDFLEEAAAETYNWIKAFGRNIDRAYRIFPDGEMHNITEGHGVHIMVDGEKRGMTCMLTPNGYVVASGVVHVSLPDIEIRIGDAGRIDFKVTVSYTTGILGTPFAERKVYTSTITATNDVVLNGAYDFPVELEATALGDVVVKSIDSVGIEITSVDKSYTLHKGDYVCYLLDGGERMYGLVSSDYDSSKDDALICEKLDGDMRHSVMMKVELPDWQDRNMLPAVENYLRDALVNYIIWRWFETVYPKEAETFHDKWEDKAHKAQLGLNSERKILQRKATWLQ